MFAQLGVDGPLLEQRAAEKVLWQNIALGLPSVNAGGQYTDNIELPALFFDINADGTIDKLQFGTRYTSVGNLSINQLVFDGSYLIALFATDVLRDQASLNKEKTEIEVRQLFEMEDFAGVEGVEKFHDLEAMRG